MPTLRSSLIPLIFFIDPLILRYLRVSYVRVWADRPWSLGAFPGLWWEFLLLCWGDIRAAQKRGGMTSHFLEWAGVKQQSTKQNVQLQEEKGEGLQVCEFLFRTQTLAKMPGSRAGSWGLRVPADQPALSLCPRHQTASGKLSWLSWPGPWHPQCDPHLWATPAACAVRVETGPSFCQVCMWLELWEPCVVQTGGTKMINFKRSGMVTLQQRSEKAGASVNLFKFSMETLPENTSLCAVNGRNSWMQDIVALIPLSEERQRAHSSKWSGYVPGALDGMESECICMLVKLLPHHPLASKHLWWWFW